MAPSHHLGQYHRNVSCRGGGALPWGASARQFDMLCSRSEGEERGESGLWMMSMIRSGFRGNGEKRSCRNGCNARGKEECSMTRCNGIDEKREGCRCTCRGGVVGAVLFSMHPWNRWAQMFGNMFNILEEWANVLCCTVAGMTAWSKLGCPGWSVGQDVYLCWIGVGSMWDRSVD